MISRLVHTHPYIYIYIYIYLYMYIQLCSHLYIWIQMCIYTFIHFCTFDSILYTDLYITTYRSVDLQLWNLWRYLRPTKAHNTRKEAGDSKGISCAFKTSRYRIKTNLKNNITLDSKIVFE